MILNGDCLSRLKEIESNTIDSLVTDPPAGISFMGKAWDDDKGGRKQWIAWMTEVMQECLRVLKPGAHGLVWALPRTSHWTATALEDAGFEVRDVVTHLFGTGFPKSLDISKAIDKSAGAEREVMGSRMKNTGTHYYESGAKMGRANYGVRQGDAKIKYENVELLVTAPATDAAKQWDGWGTALKPASEHWVLVRKPISEKTVAANVLKHGVGALNIDASRVKTNEILSIGAGKSKTYGQASSGNNPGHQHIEGRFPSNLVLSHSEHCTDAQCDIECAVKQLDEQSGITPATKQKIGAAPRKNIGFKLSASSADRSDKIVNYASNGNQGASRFFYCSKASRSDKGASNTHPTVKATKLMQYLIRMITPPKGIVLDPFTGSGSTGVAAVKEGFDFIGIEQNEEYSSIAKTRINEAHQHG